MEWLDAAQYDWKEIGKADLEDIRIHINEEVTLSILKWNRRWMGGKSFGILIGSKDDKGNYTTIHIDHSIPVGKLGDKSGKPILTDGKWNSIEERMVKKYPGKQIVGWYGVRTGWASMLTEMDQRIHQDFFHKPWQIIYMLDGKTGLGNFYYRYQNRLKRCEGYYQYEADNIHKKRSKGFRVMSVVVAILFLLLYVKYIHPNIFQREKGNEDRNILSVSDTRQDEEIEKRLRQENRNLKNVIAQLENEIKAKEQEIIGLKEEVQPEIEEGATDDTSIDGRIMHRIEKGDTLIKISKRYYGDSSYSAALGKVNRISNHKSLQVGDYLIIPPKEEIEE